MEKFNCIFRAQNVISRQEALLCSGCGRWQHVIATLVLTGPRIDRQ